MAEKICIRCGQVLNSHTQVCPDCLAVQKPASSSSKVNTLPRDLNRKSFGDVFADIRGNDYRPNIDASRYKKQYDNSQNSRGWFISGFVLGWFVPFVFSIIILVGLKSSAKKNGEMDKILQFRKGMLRGMLIMQIALPVVLSVIGWLIEQYL